jgi:uncharacterized membrane protein HdeD (DUF308 family)
MATSAMFLNVEELRPKRGWLLALGILQIVFGVIALFLIPAATVASVLILGWLIVLSGIVEFVHAFQVRRWGGVFLHIIGGVLGVLIGLLIVTHPVAGALAWTLLFASLFTVTGLFRLITAIRFQYQNWGWAAFDGAITLLLGVLLWADWPWSGLWFLGLSLGISLLLRGWTYVSIALAMRGFAARELPRAA